MAVIESSGIAKRYDFLHLPIAGVADRLMTCELAQILAPIDSTFDWRVRREVNPMLRKHWMMPAVAHCPCGSQRQSWA
jgi:hypothetical protein